MDQQAPISMLICGNDRSDPLRRLRSYLDTIPHLHTDVSRKLPADPSRWQVIACGPETLSDEQSERLTGHVRSGGGWLMFVDPGLRNIPSLFGAQPEPGGPTCEMRVLFSKHDHPLALRLPDAIYVQGHFQPLVLDSDDAEMILYTDWQSTHRAVLVTRSYGDGSTACTTLTDVDHPVVRQILYRLICQLGRRHITGKCIGIGLLGYAPSVGQYHGQGATRTPGLELRAACDLSPNRLQQARKEFPEIRTYPSAEPLAEDHDIDLVIIATPPNTHAPLAIQMMKAGKHVVCEKPLALNRPETEAMADTAQRQGVHLSCHQNRRWDVDYLAIKRVLAQGLIGDLFHLETFVGGFSHPCGYWHSDAAISGGMTYDWGAHYIDWIIGLCGGSIVSVMGTRHKRVWHDVTNADQERIQMRFENGLEAEFIHSDIAAARKAKWYLLGTQGAIVGHWRDVTEYRIDPVHYYHRHAIPATEMPPDLTVYRHEGSDKITVVKPALPKRPLFGFHDNLADHLLTGEPLIAPLEDSMRVVAVLEAAARSMDNNGRVEVLDG
ncbi:MAG: Gfo/Idh/MocA family oxidoreductase [Desulfobacteraceae bacterium]